MHDTFERRPALTAFPPESFRTSADPARSWRQATIVHRASEWWLIHPEIAATYFVPDMQKVDLHDCVCRSGLRLVLAVFESQVEGLQEVLNEAVTLARGQWVRVEPGDDRSGVNVLVEDVGLPGLAPWPPGSFMDQLRRVFRGRCICSEVELHALFHEPNPDPVFDIHRAQFPTPTKVIKAARPHAAAR